MSDLCLSFFGGRLRISPFAIASLSLMFYIEGQASFFVILSAALLHEMGHIVAVYLLGSRVLQIELHAVGAVIFFDHAAVSYKKEALIAFSGPLANIIFGLIAAAFFLRFKSVMLLLFVLSCAFFAVFNLMPLKGNDGWNIVRALCADKKGIEFAEKATQIIAAVASALGALSALYLYRISGASPAVAALLLFSAIPS